MATLLHSESRRLYSWWWDSHIPKNSKWLQENLTDMDAKVKAMIKLIEEDADSFARRAEMYYKKRPELMKLVEEFYRAYRALAERYDHATVELRQAHRTMAEAFSEQVPYVLTDDSQSSSSGLEGGPQTPEMPHPVRALLDPDDLHKDALGLSSANLHTMNHSGGYLEESITGIRKIGLKQLNEMFGSEGKDTTPQKAAERENEKWVENEVQTLKTMLAEIEAEKEAVLLQYQQSLQKLSSFERELEDVGGLNERASRAEIEIKILKESLVKLEAERDAGLLQYNQCLERISYLENTISQTQEDAKGLNERAMKVELEASSLKQVLSELEAEKETLLHRYKQCLEMISLLEDKISLAEENAKALNEQAERAEIEINLLKQALRKLNDEKEAAELRYEQCAEKLTTMENEISRAKEDVTRLKSEILTGLEKLKFAESQCSLLERSNQSLQLEAENLVQKMATKDQELLEKENELAKLQFSLKDEHSRYVQVEVTLQALQKLHAQCQAEQKRLAIEFHDRLQILKDLETHNHDLEEDLQKVKEENQSLNELNGSSLVSITSLQNEIVSLKELKEKLEDEVELQAAQCDSLQQEIRSLNEEIDGLNRRYQDLMEQVNLVGLNPDCLASSIKELQDENLKLKEVCKNEKDEKEVLYEKLRDTNAFQEKNVILERSVSEVSGELEGSREKVKELQESCQFLQGEQSSLTAEKSMLLSQLQTMTENMQKLVDKNARLEDSLSSARVELAGVKTKSKSLEELCEILKSDKSYLQGERSTLVAQLENVEQRLRDLENRFTRLEEKYTDLEKEKESSLCQVKEMWGYLGESRLSDLENHVHLLQQDRRLSKKEFEEELDKAVNSQIEIFILQNFVHDLEEKNLSLLVECQKQIEGSKLSNKMISELEMENLEQQVEIEFLLDEFEKMRIGLRQVFRALQFDLVDDQEHGNEDEQIPLSTIFDNIEGLKTSHMKNQDEKQQLLVENMVLYTLLEQLRLEGAEIESEKKTLVQEFMTMNDQCNILQNDKHKLLEINRKLRLEVSNNEKQEEVLRSQLETQHEDLLSLQTSYWELREENLKALGENSSLLQKYLDLQRKLHTLEVENCSILQKAWALDNLSLVFESFGTEKVEDIEILSEDISRLHMMNDDHKKKIEMLGEKLDAQEVESWHLNDTIEKLQQELHESKDLAYQLHCQILIGNIFLRQKATVFFQAESRLRAMHTLNEELLTVNKELKRECEESKITREHLEKKVLDLSKDSINQNKALACLNEANENLESEVSLLRNEVEERRTREDILTLELQEKSNEFGLWEAEASSFYFDLQITSIQEVLLENKVHELTEVCESLKDENAEKDAEIEQMKERFHLLECEVGRFKAQMSAYVPIIASLGDDIESLEHNALYQRKHSSMTYQEPMGAEMTVQSAETTNKKLTDDKRTLAADGISDLIKMQTKVKAIDKALLEEVGSLRLQGALNKQQEAPVEGSEQQRISRNRLNGENECPNEMEPNNEFAASAKLHENNSEISEARNGTLMKDIPLDQVSDSSLYKTRKSRSDVADDQMLELWEYAEQDSILDPTSNSKKNEVTPLSGNVGEIHRFKDVKQKSPDHSFTLEAEKEVGVDKLEVSLNAIREPNLEGPNILERLASSAPKLTSLQTSVQILKNKMRASKRGKKKATDQLKARLQEVEKTFSQLVDTYHQLTKDIEKPPLPSEGNISVGSEEAWDVHRKQAMESAWKWFQNFGQLQFEVQSIHDTIQRSEDEKKSKGKHGFPGSGAGILLRDIIYRGRRNGRNRKKACFCGCARPSINEA